jgi:hypothetical protein
VEGKRRRTVQAGRPFGALNKPKPYEILNNKSITELFSTQSESSQSTSNTPESSMGIGSSTQSSTQTREIDTKE